MKKKVVRLIEIIVLVGVLGFALAQVMAVHASESHCRDLLTEQFTRDSNYVSFHADDLNVPDFGRDYLAFSVRAIRLYIERLGCKQHDINFAQGAQGVAHSRCETIVRDRDNSRMCYVESNLGYWFIHKDFVEDIHIMFHRWD
ncbi:MAG TPA: hypothetical protein DCY86_16685 [Bdellovibrionales bacterium]|nr:hypothetical protein [Bdellovibrionales bacterium]